MDLLSTKGHLGMHCAYDMDGDHHFYHHYVFVISFTVEHALSCLYGGFPTIHHNEVRDITADLMSDVCHNVGLEPTLQPLLKRGYTTALQTLRMELMLTSRRRDSGKITDSVHFSMLGFLISLHTHIIHSHSPPATDNMSKKRRGPMTNV